LCTYIVVSNIPEKEIENKTNINSNALGGGGCGSGTTASLDGITSSLSQGLCQSKKKAIL
jgi:hypothetical protein